MISRQTKVQLMTHIGRQSAMSQLSHQSRHEIVIMTMRSGIASSRCGHSVAVFFLKDTTRQLGDRLVIRVKLPIFPRRKELAATSVHQDEAICHILIPSKYYAKDQFQTKSSDRAIWWAFFFTLIWFKWFSHDACLTRCKTRPENELIMHSGNIDQDCASWSWKSWR